MIPPFHNPFMPVNTPAPGAVPAVSLEAFAEKSTTNSVDTLLVEEKAVNQTISLRSLIVSAKEPAIFKLIVGDKTKVVIRTNPAKLTENVLFEDAIVVSSGQTLKVFGYHEHIINQKLSASVFGVRT